MISIFIPTKNAGNDFEKVLLAIFDQKEEFEVVVVDSGSTDNTLEIARRFPQIKLFQITPEEFGHGKTRNEALKLCSGEFIVFLSQDAKPANDFWLEKLVAPIKNYLADATYSRQIPKPDAHAPEKLFYSENFPSEKKEKPNRKQSEFERIFFSNVASCVRRDILQRFPFNENLIMSEDQEFSQRIQNAGKKVYYAYDSEVIHSHNYKFKQIVGRYFDSAYSLRQILGKKEFSKVLTRGISRMWREFYFCAHYGFRGIYDFKINNIAKILGTFLATIQKSLGSKNSRAISMHKYYWN